MHSDILERLRIDPGQRTFGQLIQDREAAAHEIRRLQAEIERLRAARTPRGAKAQEVETAPPFQPAMLIRLTELSKLLGVSRSTIYKWVNEGTFPAPVRVSERAVRWRMEDVEAWRDAL